MGTVTAGPDPSTSPTTTQLPAIESWLPWPRHDPSPALVRSREEAPISGRPRGVNRSATRVAGQSSPES
jgi:hypothetical protein